jgi:hypothetical protein
MVCATALFCEDVREEKLGTVTVVGIFPDNVTVQSIPFNFPKLAIYARISFGVSDRAPTRIALRIVHGDGEATFLTVFERELIDRARCEAQEKEGPSVGLVATAVISPFHVKQAGRINVMVKADEEDESVCGTLNILASAE